MSTSKKNNNFPVPRTANPNSKSRFGKSSSRFSGSNRFGGSSSSSRFSSGSRFSTNETIKWTITPMRKIAIRISLQGLGDPLHRIIGTKLNPELSDPNKLLKLISTDEDIFHQLTKALDDAWQSYSFRGAALLYPWEQNICKAFTDAILPLPPPPPKPDNANEDDDDYLEYEDDDDANTTSTQIKQVKSLRAIDATFVINILARSRANTVIGNTPLALETGFLDKTVICDDPRIVDIAQATGCIDEDW